MAIAAARAAALGLLILLPSCRKETIDKPPPPSMSDVIDAFAVPTGTFDASTAGAIRSAIDDAEKGLLGASVQDRLFAAIQEAIGNAAANRSQTKSIAAAPTSSASPGAIAPRDFEGEGFARVTRICDGWTGVPTPDDAANGHLDLTFTFSKITLDPVVWGDATKCLYLLGDKRLRIDHGAASDALRLYVGESTKVEDLAKTPIILALDLNATLDDKPVAGKLAVRFVYQAAEVELLVPVRDGDVAVTVAGGNPLQVRAKNGTFECDVATQRCKNQAGLEVQF